MPTPRVDPTLLVPDLQTLPPFQLYIQATVQGGKDLRFGTTVVNTGPGPLELLGLPDPSGRTIVTQRIDRVDGGVTERPAGSFILHDTHQHWHFEDFFQFDLWTYRPDGGLDQLLASTGKLTFCIFDTERSLPELANAAKAGDYETCGQRTQGISVGWGDTYDATVPGQSLDITEVPDGRYALRSTADPDDRLLEMDETNNANVIYVEISGFVVERLDGP